MKTRRLAAFAVTVVAAVGSIEAGGALHLQGSGAPYRWPDGGRSIPFNPDLGGLGKLDAATALASTEAAFAAWGAVPTSSVSYRNAGPLPVDVNATNFGPYLFAAAPDGRNAVVFDQNGTIFSQLFGFGSGVLGFAGPEWIDPSSGAILESYAFVNGGPNLLLGFPTSEMYTILVHEFGHYANLAHTVINGQVALYGDPTGPFPFDTFPREDLTGRIETMYPFLFRGGGQETLHADDVASLSRLYPEPGFAATHGTITGRVLRVDGLTRASGINVIARNVADPFDDAVSSISGDLTDSTSQADPQTGVYRIEGLTPGATYAVYVDRILAGGFSTPPFFPYPAPEEFYNGKRESRDPYTDDPAQYEGLVAVAGETTSGADIFLNRLPPGPIPLGDEQSGELALPFPFRFCGREYTLVFVNSNGMLTFERASNNPLETTSGFFSGPPRIAGLWDDLDPGAGGTLTFDETPNAFQVRWLDVPEYATARRSSFAIALRRASSQVELSYGDIAAFDGIAGLSCGGRLTSRYERQSDLSAFGDRTSSRTLNARNTTALYEEFVGVRPNDLDHRTLRLSAPNEPRDLLEPDDDLVHARHVRPPYFTSGRFTGIFPRGDDVDFYRFSARAGETIVAETRPGNQLDTVLGVFDVETGNLVAVDDDSGSGLLSWIAFPVPRDGAYAVAVSTYPDFDFTGDGPSEGRYVLDLRTLPGALVPLTDESSAELAFGSFAFPFAGAMWDSVFVNSNGNLTFGAEHLDFTPTVGELLGGMPRIAPLWDDFDPGVDGYVYVSRTADSMTVTFDDVPEFGRTLPNDFSVTMWATGEIEMRYGVTARADGIVGVSPGGGAVDPGEIDLSAVTGPLAAPGPVYEQFGFGQVDLDGLVLSFVP